MLDRSKLYGIFEGLAEHLAELDHNIFVVRYQLPFVRLDLPLASLLVKVSLIYMISLPLLLLNPLDFLLLAPLVQVGSRLLVSLYQDSILEQLQVVHRL